VIDRGCGDTDAEHQERDENDLETHCLPPFTIKD
jgi:hypothetical protein